MKDERDDLLRQAASALGDVEAELILSSDTWELGLHRRLYLKLDKAIEPTLGRLRAYLGKTA